MQRARRNVSGFLLPAALIFLFILLLLMVNLIYLEKTQVSIYEQDELAFERRWLASQTQNQLGLLLAGHKGPQVGPATLAASFRASSERADLSLKWAKGASVFRPAARSWASFESLFRKPEDLPSAAYSQTDQGAGGIEVAPDHTLARFEASGRAAKTVVYSAGFPFGAYAPYGTVSLASAQSWANPSMEETKVKGWDRFTALPVHILAQGKVAVTAAYPYGSIFSDEGPIELAAGAGAIGYSGVPVEENIMVSLRAQVESSFRLISADNIDKTHLFDDAVLNLDGFKRILDGKMGFDSILGVGQSCKIPFFPIPSIQNDLFVIVFALHHPWPVDFSGQAHGAELSEEIADLSEDLKERKAELAELEKELAGLDPTDADADAEDEIAEMKSKVAAKNSEIRQLQLQLDRLLAKAKANAENVSDRISVSEVPDNAQEEAEQTVDGWSYAKIIGNLAQIVADLIGGRDPMRNLFVPTRVVNLGDQDPEWEWGSGRINPKATITVPRGRTLRLHKDLEIQGDLWLQRGSTMHIKGSNLKVTSPGPWKDFNGVIVAASDLAAYPSGRILMEPGSSLLVDGNLEVDGGTRELGSVLLVSSIGPVRAIDCAILVKGNVKIAHGIHPGMGLDDLVLKLAGQDQKLKSFLKDFFNPLMFEVFPFISRLPYVGPWQWRKCWFASYATTFEFFPELIVAPGPYPIPLPFPNCLPKVFKAVSIAFSTELNFTTGENLYTHSPFWVFGRGVVPVLSKTDPELVGEAFSRLKWDKIATDAITKQGEEFLKELLPTLAESIISEVFQEIMVSIVQKLIPFTPPTCPGGKSEESEEVEKLEDIVKRYLKGAIKETGKGLYDAFRLAVQDIRLEVYSKINDESAPHSIYREVPGVLLYAGGKMTIGNDGAALAAGMLVAEDELVVHARRTVGCLLSGSGSIQAEALYHYPYFSRASLFNPRKPKDYKFPGFDDFFRSAFQVEIPQPDGNTALDIGRTTYHVTAEGWDL